MDTVVNILASRGWSRTDDFDIDDPRPYFLRGRWKAIVGRNWTTFYEMVGPSKIGRILSVPTGDPVRVREASRKVAA